MKLLTTGTCRRFLMATVWITLVLVALTLTVKAQPPETAQAAADPKPVNPRQQPKLPAALSNLKTLAPKEFNFDSEPHAHFSQNNMEWWLAYQALPVSITGLNDNRFTVAFSGANVYEPKGDVFTIVRGGPDATDFFDSRSQKLEKKSEQFFWKELKNNPNAQWLIFFDRHCGLVIHITREEDLVPAQVQAQPAPLPANTVTWEEFRTKNSRPGIPLKRN
jgi:hypothetical protein